MFNKSLYNTFTVTVALSLSLSLPCYSQSKKAFLKPSTDNAMKTWWFFGYEKTTDEGIHEDVKALKDAGFGGVVYYDQNHRKPNQAGEQPEDGFSPEWWKHLKYAAREAHKARLSFELNISNGYVAGGRWIDAEHAMKRVASSEVHITISDAQKHVVRLPVIKSIKDNYIKDIAVLAIPVKDTTNMRHITAFYKAKGKGRNGAMQGPVACSKIFPDGTTPTDANNTTSFIGYGFKEYPRIGTLQASNDSLSWQDVVTLEPMYSSQGGYFSRTTSFKPTKARFFRINYNGKLQLKEWHVGPEAFVDRWEEKAGLHSDFVEGNDTPEYKASDIIHTDEIVDLTSCVDGDEVTVSLPKGEWKILRLASVLTGAKSKHGRGNLLGYECDKLSTEAAELHWNSYVQVILDSLRADGIDWVEGVTMDSHEGGSQNWTPLMLKEFESRRGYSFTPYLPVLAGYVVDSKETTDRVLRDYRLTLADCMRDNYYATFQRLATKNNITFTAQAIGNALCIMGDAISVKQVVDKPQGEFWSYQTEGAYDIKDCSSACHLYGKRIASAEAMTDAMYKNNPSDLKRVADIAFSFGAQEFVVCSTPHIPVAHPTEPYVAGREYAINRSNPKWNDMKPVWQQVARSIEMLRQGVARPDVLIYLGDEIPIKILTNRLPSHIDGLDWDACTGDALANCLSVTNDGKLTTKSGVEYKALIIEDAALISPKSAEKIKELKAQGIKVVSSGKDIERAVIVVAGDAASLVHTHRYVNGKDMYFVANITSKPLAVKLRLSGIASKAEIWRTVNGKVEKLLADADGCFNIVFAANESLFVLASK